jgi:hypothetical protein
MKKSAAVLSAVDLPGTRRGFQRSISQLGRRKSSRRLVL